MPLQDNQLQMSAMPPAQLMSMQGGNMSLSVLMDYMIQRTYHDLNVLSELLPRKTDMERKLEIAQFANRTRLMFIRLLALVKWAGSTSKVDKCTVISNFLSQQSMLFTETADMLAHMARDTLVKARLPAFSIPCAVDVLTTGTFPRLPACIREKIIPSDPISAKEKKQTLQRLNQIIEHRLVSVDLPRRMKQPMIYNGRVCFKVENEFKVSLTLMGDNPTIPWRLLDVEILVENPEADDSTALVHSLQVGYLHQLVQSRLLESDQPLHDLYNVLHSFCQSLQLEVLITQAKRLIGQRMGEALVIEEYRRGQSLVLCYWRDAIIKDGQLQSCRLSIKVDDQDPSYPLKITHTPTANTLNITRLTHLSVERLLVQAMQSRGLAQLKELERELKLWTPGPCHVKGIPSTLHVPLLTPPTAHETLTITIDPQTGKMMVALGVYKETALTKEIQNALNRDRRLVRPLLTKLRLWLALEHCRQSAEQMPASCFRLLPLCNLAEHELSKLSPHRMYIRLPSHDQFYLVVELLEQSRRSLEYHYYLLEVHRVALNCDKDDPNDPRLYLKAGQLLSLDKFMCTHFLGTKLFTIEPEDPLLLNRKRKLFRFSDSSASKKPKLTTQSLPDLQFVVAQCENKLPLILLAFELEAAGLAHTDITVWEGSCGTQLMLQSLHKLANLPSEALNHLKKGYLGCSIQVNNDGVIQPYWLMEVLFCDNPLRNVAKQRPGPISLAQFRYSMCGLAAPADCVKAVKSDWYAMASLFKLVREFAAIYKGSSQLQVELHIMSYDMKCLNMAYGPTFCYTVSVRYDTKRSQFVLDFGVTAQQEVQNCHLLTAVYLQSQLNDTGSLINLVHLLLDTWRPLRALNRLSPLPYIGVGSNKQTTATSSFVILVQSATHIHLTYREESQLDIHLKRGRMLSIRDAAYGMFDSSKVIEGLNPIQGLKSFLLSFVDSMESVRRQSTTEDDHPPTPEANDSLFDTLFGGTGLDSPLGGMSSTSGLGGMPVSKRQDQGMMMFKSPMTSPSNPLAPASPASRYLQAHPSPGGLNFPLQSPPSGIAPSPSMMAPSPSNHMAPSPGSFATVPSPSPMGLHLQSPAIGTMAHALQGGSQLTSPPQSRVLPQRLYAASVPVILTHNALDRMLTPTVLPGEWNSTGSASSGMLICPLERFLGSVSLRKKLRNVIQTEPKDTLVQIASEVGVVHLKGESLLYKVMLHPVHQQCLVLKVQATGSDSHMWTQDQLSTLEKFFHLKVASPPYRAPAIHAFSRILGLTARFLKDFIHIMKLELSPEPSQRWLLSLCMTTPYGAPLPGADPGPPGVAGKDKILVMMQLRGKPELSLEHEVVVLPILHIAVENNTQVIARTLTHPTLQEEACRILAPFNAFSPNNPGPSECTLYPAVRELAIKLGTC